MRDIASEMEAFYRTHSHLIELLNNPVRRTLMDEIDWDDRVICIKGYRGVGKTTFLLQYARDNYARSKKCLYVDMDGFLFCDNDFCEFVDNFVSYGGQVLLLDQVGKYPGWDSDIKTCIERHSSLRIVCAIASAAVMDDDALAISSVAKFYRLRGLSFVEYLNFSTINKFRSYRLADMLSDSAGVIGEVTHSIAPQDFFQNYLHHGCFPYLLEKKSFRESLLKAINLSLEIDVHLARQIDLKYLPKLKQMLYYLADGNMRNTLNISHLADYVQVSRATVMNYLKFMKDAGLLTLTYQENGEYPKKPTQILISNPNIAYVVCPAIGRAAISEIYALYALAAKHQCNKDKRADGYVIDNEYALTFVKPAVAKDDCPDVVFRSRKDNSAVRIPLWLLGFAAQ